MAKFALGAWLVIVIIPILVGAMVVIHRQYERRRLEIHVRPETIIDDVVRRQRVIVPVRELTRDVVQAIKFGHSMSDDLTAVHVTDDLDRAEDLRRRFERQIPGVPFVIVESPYRQLVRPLVRYLEQAAGQAEDDVLVVLLPEYVPRHWWERFLLQRERAPDPERPARPEEHARRRRAVSTGRLAETFGPIEPWSVRISRRGRSVGRRARRAGSS